MQTILRLTTLSVDEWNSGFASYGAAGVTLEADGPSFDAIPLDLAETNLGVRQWVERVAILVTGGFND